MLLLLFKVALVADLVTLAVFVADYTRLTRGGAWKDPVGQTIVLKSALLALAILPSVLSLFFRFSRLTSHIAGWFDVAAFGAIAVVMAWRTVTFERIHREKGRDQRQEREP